MKSQSLPNGWIDSKVGDLVTFEYGKGLTKKQRDSSGTFPVYGSSGIVGRHTEALVSKPCLVIGRKGSIGEVYLSSEPCWPIDTTYYAIIPESIPAKFMYYLSGSLGLNYLDKSTTIPGLNRDDAHQVNFCLPPLPEQHRIVAKIEELFSRLDAGVVALKQVQTQLKQYRQAVLKAAVEGRLTVKWREKHKGELEPASELLERILKERLEKWETEQLAKYDAKGQKPPKDWRDKYKEPAPPDTANLPELPEGWVWASVEQVGFVVSGSTPKGINAIEEVGEIPWYKVGDMNNSLDGVHMGESRTNISEELARALNLWILKKGAMIFPKRGGAIKTGKKRIIIKPSAIDLNTMGIEAVEPMNLNWVWNWLLGVNLSLLSDGSNVPQINYGDIAYLWLPIPPLAEQQKINDLVEKHLNRIASYIRESSGFLTTISNLHQSILKRAFEGKLVPQDPEDEPAEKLLERIKAEKGKREATKRQRKRQGQQNTAQLDLGEYRVV